MLHKQALPDDNETGLNDDAVAVEENATATQTTNEQKEDGDDDLDDEDLEDED